MTTRYTTFHTEGTVTSAVSGKTTQNAILAALGMKHASGNFAQLRRAAKRYGLSLPAKRYHV